MRYECFTPSGCKDIDILIFKFVAKIQFLYFHSFFFSEHTTNSIQRSTGRKSDSQVSKRSNQSERRYDNLTNERQGGSTNEKGGSVSSKKSWTNEKFEKLYEPVTVTELKRKRQMKQIRNHLRTMAPDLDKYVLFSILNCIKSIFD